MKIIIIDDEKELTSFLKLVLENEGHQTTICDSIEEVIKNDYELSHDLIILDLT